MLSSNAQLVCMNGNSAAGYAVYSDTEKNVSITANEGTENCKKTVIRECDVDSRLFELYLDINVLTNTLP